MNFLLQSNLSNFMSDPHCPVIYWKVHFLSDAPVDNSLSGYEGIDHHGPIVSLLPTQPGAIVFPQRVQKSISKVRLQSPLICISRKVPNDNSASMKRTEGNLGETGYRLEVSEKMLVSVFCENEGNYSELRKVLILFPGEFIQMLETACVY